jgi:hypothetical protein
MTDQHPDRMDMRQFVAEAMAAMPPDVQERAQREWEAWPRVTVALTYDHGAGTFTVLGWARGFLDDLPEGTTFTVMIEAENGDPGQLLAVVMDITDPGLAPLA